MEKLQTFYLTVKDIDELCEKIIRAAVPILRNVKTEGDGMINKIKKRNRKLTDAEIKDKLQLHSLSLVKDAKNIRKEMPIFIDTLLTNDSLENAKLSFLQEVWFGDLYGASGVEALGLLREDLKKQLGACTLENIIERVVA